MESQEYIDEKIWDYLDGTLDGFELEDVRNKIRTDERWNAAIESVSLLHKELHEIPLEQPSMNFTAKVMQRVKNPETQKRKTSLVVPAIALFFGICILFLLLKAAFSGELNSDVNRLPSAGTIFFEQYNQVKGSANYLFISISVLLMLILADRLFIRRQGSL